MYGGTLLSESQSRDAHRSRLVMGWLSDRQGRRKSAECNTRTSVSVEHILGRAKDSHFLDSCEKIHSRT